MYYNNKRLALIVFWIVLGAVLVVLTVTEVLDSSIYSGMGGALMAVGTLQLIRAVKYRKDSEYKEKVDTELGDERNRFLRMKSWSWARESERSLRWCWGSERFSLYFPILFVWFWSFTG